MACGSSRTASEDKSAINKISGVTFSSKRKYSCMKDASVEEHKDCFSDSVILPVSLEI